MTKVNHYRDKERSLHQFLTEQERSLKSIATRKLVQELSSRAEEIKPGEIMNNLKQNFARMFNAMR